MPGLVLKLRPGEQLLINGVVVENGDKKTRLRIRTEGAHILRLREAMKPEDAVTPLRRAYYIAQMAVAGLLEPDNAREILTHTLAQIDSELSPAIRDGLRARLAGADFYQTMRQLGELIARERGPKPCDLGGAPAKQAEDRAGDRAGDRAMELAMERAQKNVAQPAIESDLPAPKLRAAMTG